MRQLVSFCIFAALAVLVPVKSKAEDALKLAIGQRGAFENSISELGQAQGIFKKHGLVLDILYTQGSGESEQAVIAGAADIGVGIGTLGTFGAFAKGAPVRVIGASMSGSYEYWYVPSSSPINAFKDAAGKSVAFSTRGSSTNLMVLGLAKLNGVTVSPVATGSPVSTLTQTLSKQVDVGWGFPPIGIDQLNKGQIRVIARGKDVPEFAHQTLRFLIVNKQSLDSKRDALVRYMQAYRETLEWMYSDPAAVKAYATYAKIPEQVAQRTRDEFVPKENANPDKIAGLDDAMRNAVDLKFIAAPLSAPQIKELIQVPFR